VVNSHAVTSSEEHRAVEQLVDRRPRNSAADKVQDSKKSEPRYLALGKVRPFLAFGTKFGGAFRTADEGRAKACGNTEHSAIDGTVTTRA
jgi:hypothetical protein